VIVPAIKLPVVIVTLSDEHRYMNLLVETLDEILERTDTPGVGDYFLMQDIVRYMHEYSDTVHHPTEDLMFDKLVRRNPASKKNVARLRREHEMLEKNTSKLMKQLEDAAKRRTPEDAAAVHAAARTYIKRLRQHMQFEEHELFPDATRCLAHKDWHSIEARLQAADDPLFGETVKNEYRALYEYFADRSNSLSRKVTNFGFLQLDNMIVSADAIETGITEMWEMLQDHGSSLEQEFRNLADQLADDRGLLARIELQTRYASFVGKTALEAGGGAAGIYLRTLKNAAVSFFKGAQ
jgi:hemerythrin-like domain-containing protein